MVNNKYITVWVYDNNIEKALKTLKNKMNKHGVLREAKRRRFYAKPSEVRRRKKRECIKRIKKSKAQKKQNNRKRYKR